MTGISDGAAENVETGRGVPVYPKKAPSKLKKNPLEPLLLLPFRQVHALRNAQQLVFLVLRALAPAERVEHTLGVPAVTESEYRLLAYMSKVVRALLRPRPLILVLSVLSNVPRTGSSTTLKEHTNGRRTYLITHFAAQRRDPFVLRRRLPILSEKNQLNLSAFPPTRALPLPSRNVYPITTNQIAAL
ncbi:uncharacterized protein LACBIDRAFT_327794 [Laccaria bicolor S238N-H82]|uniref:Predicted protein n=1 Tax=Laccaria bicolor (strain S238N-H82 / ATCC MYA-4686) TaxID=486041 RepID=B0DCV1_LACBS|nr:uncharacterized protein LACBIDRAFT_327794 [Laccaria bicolor S238N-H82]EDR07360.1 predicted protein [Laccaria bicolor S238N-H82]|eukprot:XP_001881752.1 predicted protein [Laccaria bicolor S238N-H82]